jgi:RNA polymerase sigma factor (sigma-70 family)
MNGLSDQELLRDYAGRRSEEAFAELVRRHIDFVYSAALRMVRNTHLAEDVTQSVFLALAQSAPALAERPVLAGWLHRTTHHLAVKAVRSDARRRAREQDAIAMNQSPDEQPNALWEEIAPQLDAALHELNEVDRDALLLRYFQRKTAREIAVILGTTEEAAQKRVTRALERLRKTFAKRGVTVGAAGLALALTANAVQAAPAGLAAAVSSASILTGAAVAAPLTTNAAITKALLMTTLQKAAITALVVATLGIGLYKARQASVLEAQVQSLQDRQAALSNHVRQLETQRDQVKSRLATLADQLKNAKGTPDELLKLRAEVTRLHDEANQAKDPFVQTALTWKEKETSLRQLFEEHPDQSIPELQLLDNDYWLNAAMHANLDTDAGVRSAMSGLRHSAENQFAIKLQNALHNFMQTNNGRFPDSLAQLQSYFDPSLAQALERYEIRPAKDFPSNGGLGGDLYITQKAAVDPDYDARWVIGENGFSNTSFKGSLEEQALAPAINTLNPALKAYSAANNGLHPSDPAQLQPYITTPAQQAALQQVLQARATNKPGM